MLKVNLMDHANGLVFQVERQDPTIGLFLESLGGRFKASNNWTIKSVYVPEIDIHAKTIFLRGSESNSDLKLWVVDGLTPSEIKAIGLEIKVALTEFVDQLDQWINKSSKRNEPKLKKSPTNHPKVYMYYNSYEFLPWFPYHIIDRFTPTIFEA